MADVNLTLTFDAYNVTNEPLRDYFASDGNTFNIGQWFVPAPEDCRQVEWKTKRHPRKDELPDILPGPHSA